MDAGYDLRSVCRELSRLVRDLLVLKVDPRRITDPEIATDGERERLEALATRFSQEDLLRGFDVLSRVEFEIRGATQPRYNFEVAMLRWMHLRKLVPLTELIDGLEQQPAPTPGAGQGRAQRAERPAASTGTSSRAQPPMAPATGRSTSPRAAPPASAEPGAAEPPADAGAAFLAELKRTKKFFHGTVVAQAQQVEVDDRRVTFVFTEAQHTLAKQVEMSGPWLEALATRVMGQKMTVGARKVAGPAAAASPEPGAVAEARQPTLEPATGGEPSPDTEPPPPTEPPPDLNLSPVHRAGPVAEPAQPKQTSDGPADDLLSQAMGDEAVQTMLDVFSAEIKGVEEI